jgi:hypothetical protein
MKGKDSDLTTDETGTTMVRLGYVVSEALRLAALLEVSGMAVVVVNLDDSFAFVPCGDRQIGDICEDLRPLTDDGAQVLGFVWHDVSGAAGGRLLPANEGNPDGTVLLARAIEERQRASGSEARLRSLRDLATEAIGLRSAGVEVVVVTTRVPDGLLFVETDGRTAVEVSAILRVECDVFGGLPFALLWREHGFLDGRLIPEAEDMPDAPSRLAALIDQRARQLQLRPIPLAG